MQSAVGLCVGHRSRWLEVQQGLLCPGLAAGHGGHCYLKFSSHGRDEQHHGQPCQAQLAGPHRWQPLQGRQSQIHAGLTLPKGHDQPCRPDPGDQSACQ